MYPADDIANITKEITQTEIRLKTVEIAISNVDRQLELVTLLESSLNENIHLLKQDKIITLATEFKKAKADLKKAKTRRSFLIDEKAMMLKAYNTIHKNIIELRNQYIKLVTTTNNVISIKTGQSNE